MRYSEIDIRKRKEREKEISSFVKNKIAGSNILQSRPPVINMGTHWTANSHYDWIPKDTIEYYSTHFGRIDSNYDWRTYSFVTPGKIIDVAQNFCEISNNLLPIYWCAIIMRHFLTLSKCKIGLDYQYLELAIDDILPRPYALNGQVKYTLPIAFEHSFEMELFKQLVYMDQLKLDRLDLDVLKYVLERTAYIILQKTVIVYEA